MEAELITFPVPSTARLIPGGSTIEKRRAGKIGRPRTRQIRKVAHEALEVAEVELLKARPLASLPAAKAEASLPPLRRLSLAKQIEIAYREQQPRITREVIDRRDKLVYTEQVLGWRVEVWITGETRNTDKPRYFYRTEHLTLGARGGQNRRSKDVFATPQECLEVARWKAGKRERLWRGKGKRADITRLLKNRPRWRGGYIPPSRTDTRLIDAITSCDCPVSDALCPVCHKRIERNNYAVRSHLRPHMKDGLIQSSQAEDIVSFLVAPRHQSQVMHA